MEKKYEGCFLLKPDISEEDTEKESAFIREQIENNGGAIVKTDMWGKKRLAYPIEKQADAVYCIFYFTASPESIALIEKPFRRRENILRHLVIQRKKLPEPAEEKETPQAESGQDDTTKTTGGKDGGTES